LQTNIEGCRIPAHDLSVRKFSPLLWLGAALVAALILWHRLQSVRFADVVQQIREVGAGRLAIALACCATCYVLVGCYERLAYRRVTGRPDFWIPFRAGLIANPIGRAIGAALFSGGALRYRLYSKLGISAVQVSGIVLLALMPFVLAALLLIDISLLTQPAKASKALHLSTNVVKTVGVIGLCVEAGWLVFVARRKVPLSVRGKTIQLPSFKHTLAQIGIGVIQLSSIAGILYALMPAELNMTWPEFVGIYCIAFVAGQMSNVPAGLGVLEAALLLMLPQIPPGKLIGAVLAYRGVFELLPLIAAVISLFAVEAGTKTGTSTRTINQASA
jgi:uncharacterized membrane protein YbhN (UPF0104 family)